MDSSLPAIQKDENNHDVYKPTTVTHEYIKKKGAEKYKHELEHLLPFRIKTSAGSEMPVDHAGCFAFIYFSWLTPLVWRSFRKGLKKSDAYKCSILDSSRVNGARIANIWEDECHNSGLHNASLERVLTKFVFTRVLIASLFYLLCLISGYLSATIFLKNLLDYIENEDPSQEDSGVKWTLYLVLNEVVRASSFSIMYAISIRTAIRSSSGINALLYNKLLTTRPNSNKTIGEIVNLFANDISKVYQMIYIFPLTISGPIIAIFTIIYTWWLIGAISLVGMLILVIIFALQFGIAKMQAFNQKKTIAATDDRVSLMTELLTYIKLIKLYAWEGPFSESIFDLREKERVLLERCQYLQCISTSLALMTPMITTIATILAYTMSESGGDLTAAKAFTLVMVNYVAAHSIRIMPIYIRDIVNGRIALKRIEKILQNDDKDNYLVLTVNALNAIEFKKATIAWDHYLPQIIKNNERNKSLSKVSINKEENELRENSPQRSSSLSATCLFDINLEILSGKFIGITGPIGSGKTALLKSILGQMRLISGKVAARGSIAYVPQDPWILNASVRENIVFGHQFSTKRFYEAINCCGLTNDLSSFPFSENTVIGERGVTISGGQKQRISLARAYYAERDIYLLDDPLSSVDRTVSNHIFHHCILSGLKGRTILLVTHEPEHLEATDLVLFMKDGKVAKQSTHTELMKEDEDYKQLMELSKVDMSANQEVPLREKFYNRVLNLDEMRFSSPDWGDVKPLSLSKSSSDASVSEPLDIEFGGKTDPTSTHISSDGLIIDERIEKGNISIDIYKAYIQAGGGYFICFFVFVWLAFQAIASSFANWWLSFWISQGNGTIEGSGADGMQGHDIIINNPHLSYYQTVYGLSIVIVLCSSLALGYIFTKVTLTSSSQLHNEVFRRIFKSPMSFFDTVPLGRILNLFTRDTDEMDTSLPVTLDAFFQRLMLVICNLVIVILIYPWFLIPFLVLASVFWLVHKMFRGAMRDLKRIENESRSPIYSHITATIEGLSIIKAFNKQTDFIYKFTDLVDAQSSPNYLYYCSMRWLSARMDILCVLISFLACIFAISHKESVGAAFAGLVLVLSMQLSGLFQYVIRLGVDTETRFTSVERIQMYIETQKVESEMKIDKQIVPPIEWPTKGRISFRDVALRYRPGLPLALKNITFDISPKEKIGIVGRTGAGKSSITTALFRLTEINSGSIHIDGIDISTLELEELRSRISIIPQDPILFRGSVRKNLDPFNEHKIQTIMDALESVHMKHKINNLKGGIGNSIGECGTTFSAGERQLLCMARALLRNNKILILDEATSSMDTETEKLIQDTIMNVFKECTVLKIAHRIPTVLDCDRVMVMHEGNIIEFDKPSILLQNPQSLFAQMISSPFSFQ